MNRLRALIIGFLFVYVSTFKGYSQEIIETQKLASLSDEVSNNAVAIQPVKDGFFLFSFKGLKEGKTWQDVTQDSFIYSSKKNQWNKLPSVPWKKGDLASTALHLNGKIFIFGGYTVAKDHTEVTVANSHSYNPVSEEGHALAPIPVAVDDSVSFSIGGRYIYLISGWHNSGNVNLSQVYDTKENKWFQATPYPGAAVFGHSGAAVGNEFVICDGVEKIVPQVGRHIYQATNACYKGEVDTKNPKIIKWQKIKAHPGKPLYRTAAGGYKGNKNWIVFAGGSDNPYNYNGIGYNKIPSKPSAHLFAYSLEDDAWHIVGKLDTPSMDHRGLLSLENKFFIVGGMHDHQKVTNQVVSFCLREINDTLATCP